MARPGASIDSPAIANSKKPVTWNWPTQNSPSRSPRSGTSGAPIAPSTGASRISVPISRSSTKTSGGASANASFIKGQLPAQLMTMIAR